MCILTKHGIETIEFFLKECEAKRKEILDARIDTCNDINIPTIDDVISDIEESIDEEGYYYSCWGVTDNYDSDNLCLKKGRDFKI